MVLPGMPFIHKDAEECQLTGYLAREITGKINSKGWNVYNSEILHEYGQRNPRKPRMRILHMESVADIDKVMEEALKPFEPEPRDPEADVYRDRMVSQGPIYTLEAHTRYTLLPIVDNPQNPQEVLCAVEFHGKIPSFVVPHTERPMAAIYETFGMLDPKTEEKLSTYRILQPGDTIEFTGFTLRNGDVKLHTPDGIHIVYDSFLAALDNLCELSKTNP